MVFVGWQAGRRRVAVKFEAACLSTWINLFGAAAVSVVPELPMHSSPHAAPNMYPSVCNAGMDGCSEELAVLKTSNLAPSNSYMAPTVYTIEEVEAVLLVGRVGCMGCIGPLVGGVGGVGGNVSGLTQVAAQATGGQAGGTAGAAGGCCHQGSVGAWGEGNNSAGSADGARVCTGHA